MIPIGDENPRRRFPIVTVVLILANLAAFLYELSLSSQALDAFIMEAALVPRRLLQEPSLAAFGTLITCMFLHGGWSHLIGNMIFLWVFGDNVEDRLGIGLFLLTYLVTGLAASATQVAIAPYSTTPILGASGALAGIAGVYLILFPRARVRVAVPIFFFIRILIIPAPVFLVLWFVMQLVQGLASVGTMGYGGVAWFAHVGGFAAGVLVGLLVKPRLDHSEPQEHLEPISW